MVGNKAYIPLSTEPTNERWLSWRSDLFTAEVSYRIVVHPGMGKKDERLDFSSLSSGGDSWTRTNDPIDVNDVLYHHGRNYKPLSKS